MIKTVKTNSILLPGLAKGEPRYTPRACIRHYHKKTKTYASLIPKNATKVTRGKTKRGLALYTIK